jgi:hypothetical protein
VISVRTESDIGLVTSLPVGTLVPMDLGVAKIRSECPADTTGASPQIVVDKGGQEPFMNRFLTQFLYPAAEGRRVSANALSKTPAPFHRIPDPAVRSLAESTGRSLCSCSLPPPARPPSRY